MGCPEEMGLLPAEMHTEVISLSRVVANLFSIQEPALQWMEVQSSPENHSLKSSIYQKYNHSYHWRFCFLSGPLKYFLVKSVHCSFRQMT